MRINPLLLIDGYKTDHRSQYPPQTEYVYSNLTARKSRVPNCDYTVVFGLQYLVKEYLINRFNEDFFSQPRGKIVDAYQRRMDNYLGKDSINCGHIGDLHDLGYLPIRIKALAEGTRCPIKVPSLTIINTLPEFFWLTNSLETLISNNIWQPMTSATTADLYRKTFDRYAELTGIDPDFVKYMGHDFSMRGMGMTESSLASGGGHLTSFVGTDTVAAIDWIEEYYGDDSSSYNIGASVKANEHSVTSSNIEHIMYSLKQTGEWNGIKLEDL